MGLKAVFANYVICEMFLGTTLFNRGSITGNKTSRFKNNILFGGRLSSINIALLMMLGSNKHFIVNFFFSGIAVCVENFQLLFHKCVYSRSSDKDYITKFSAIYSRPMEPTRHFNCYSFYCGNYPG